MVDNGITMTIDARYDEENSCLDASIVSTTDDMSEGQRVSANFVLLLHRHPEEGIFTLLYGVRLREPPC